jgi:VanZ family protein
LRSDPGFRRWLLPVLWGAAILVATSIPGGSLPNIEPFRGVDKLVHVAMYGILGWLLARAALLVPRRPQAVARALAVALAFGAVDEIHQQIVPGRSADVADWLADATGAALGVTFTVMALTRRELET